MERRTFRSRLKKVQLFITLPESVANHEQGEIRFRNQLLMLEEPTKYARCLKPKDREAIYLPKRKMRRALNIEKQDEARKIYAKALREKTLIPLGECQHCGIEGKLHGHHKDYSKPIDVLWLCSKCHRKEHRAFEYETQVFMLTAYKKHVPQIRKYVEEIHRRENEKYRQMGNRNLTGSTGGRSPNQSDCQRNAREKSGEEYKVP